MSICCCCCPEDNDFDSSVDLEEPAGRFEPEEQGSEEPVVRSQVYRAVPRSLKAFEGSWTLEKNENDKDLQTMLEQVWDLSWAQVTNT